MIKGLVTTAAHATIVDVNHEMQFNRPLLPCQNNSTLKTSNRGFAIQIDPRLQTKTSTPA